MKIIIALIFFVLYGAIRMFKNPLSELFNPKD